MDRDAEMLHGNLTCDDGDGVTSSWVSVCPSGLWRVEQQPTRGTQSTCGNNVVVVFFLLA